VDPWESSSDPTLSFMVRMAQETTGLKDVRIMFIRSSISRLIFSSQTTQKVLSYTNVIFLNAHSIDVTRC